MTSRHIRRLHQRGLLERLLPIVLVIATASPFAVATAIGNPPSNEMGRLIACTPGTGGCLPTPVECATGHYNGHWDGGALGRMADCEAAGGHILHYEAGYLGLDQVHPTCGEVIDADQIVAGNWSDPNVCQPVAVAKGFGLTGRGFAPGVSSRRGVVAAESPAAAKAGIEMLDAGGNATDAAAATVLAMGVARPEMCSLGGIGEFLYRGVDGRTGAIEFEPTAPRSVKPDLYSGQGLWQLDVGHRVVGVPGIPAGVASALKRYGTLSFARALAPAIRLAHKGVAVTPALARA